MRDKRFSVFDGFGKEVIERVAVSEPRSIVVWTSPAIAAEHSEAQPMLFGGTALSRGEGRRKDAPDEDCPIGRPSPCGRFPLTGSPERAVAPD